MEFGGAERGQGMGSRKVGRRMEAAICPKGRQAHSGDHRALGFSQGWCGAEVRSGPAPGLRLDEICCRWSSGIVSRAWEAFVGGSPRPLPPIR